MKLFTKLWNDKDVGKRFPNNLPHLTTFEEVRSLNIISNFHDEVKDSTVGWFPSDTVEQFEENKITKLDELKNNGWINDDGSPVEIKYHIDRRGFRHDRNSSKIEPGGIIYIGDSNVFGVGNHFLSNYTLQAHNNSQFKDRQYHNWGVGGRGLETYYRLLKLYLEEYKPYGVFIDFPWVASRCEVLNQHDEFHGLFLTWMYDQVYEGKMTEEYFDKRTNQIFSLPAVVLRWHKNVDAIKYLCYKHDVKCWIYNDPELWKKNDPNPDTGVHPDIMVNLVSCAPHHKYRFARDLLHTNEEWHNIKGNAFTEVLNEL